ncbi:hypothetical protein CDAR_1171 [Caerostris darwini]|uniref:Uncharacterized protein n=1 Tax=Caerostris darwini TaxID=1538125 RepID=A0AAV4SQZ2_9ARAC|nr:hypothetical protein CDAR_981 [Caerostris darwini]GIY35316.1 hypothetical protein CDAR_1171 [Caerostris darwini]
MRLRSIPEQKTSFSFDSGVMVKKKNGREWSRYEIEEETFKCILKSSIAVREGRTKNQRSDESAVLIILGNKSSSLLWKNNDFR